MSAQKIFLSQKQYPVIPTQGKWQRVPSVTKAFLTFLFLISLTFMVLVSITTVSKWGKSFIGFPFYTKTTPTQILLEGTPDQDSSNISPSEPILTTNELVHIRSNPGDNYDSIAILEAEKIAHIIGISADKQWVAVQLPYLESGFGWLRLNQVTTGRLDNVPILDDGVISLVTSTPSENSAYFTAIANVNVREGPGLNYDIVGLVNKDKRYEIVGKDANNYWWAIRNPSKPESIGWVSVDYVLARNTSVVEVIGPDSINGILIVSTPSPDQPSLSAMVIVNVRKGPGINYEIIAKLDQGQEAEVVGISKDGNWYAIKVRLEGIDIGWVSASYIQLNQDISLPVLR